MDLNIVVILLTIFMAMEHILLCLIAFAFFDPHNPLKSCGKKEQSVNPPKKFLGLF